MNSLTQFKNFMVSFAKDEEGAQVVEYALIIAVVSIGLVLALKGLTTGTTGGFSAFITRVAACLSGTAACTPSA